ncbi:hypothetical protein P280DRAFT_504011 [Massarina eburnea CBS 473.64]|uniref:Clr5 domain-containing protein n=1 Tax=Massarina eburnea CBS 473.64 TaxID=1395130 RepID=A0A6A6SAX7_9PLEO|nr:hypothetical protein P280DRAFT_504011 [Massarina eburnea CBS 473.64]
MTPTDRWEIFKPAIEQIYMTEKKKITELVAIMKNSHGFDAGENQYKYHFKKWNWKRNIPSQKKASIATQLESRAKMGKTASTISFKGRPVEMHKIRRHLKNTSRANLGSMALDRRATEPVLAFANSMYVDLNLPHAALQHLQQQPIEHASPFGLSVPTPASDIAVATPSDSANTPRDAPSPTTTLIIRKTAMERARLFSQGQHETQLNSLNKPDRIVMSDWLYQYWLFCFKTSKNWGREPHEWTSELLQFDNFHGPSQQSLPSTPDGLDHRTGSSKTQIPTPESRCRWLIHLPPNKEKIEWIADERENGSSATHDPYDESTWIHWPENSQEPPLHTCLRDALEHNNFSTIRTEDLPVAVPHLAKAAKRSPDELLLETQILSYFYTNGLPLYPADQEDAMQNGEDETEDKCIGLDLPEDDLPEPHDCEHDTKNNIDIFRHQKDLGTLWAAAQTEILTYRRLDKDSNWISEYFSMENLQLQLDLGKPVSTKFQEQGLLQTHCICGDFGRFPLPTLSDVTTRYIANLDVWNRATYKTLDSEDYQEALYQRGCVDI